MQQDNDPPPPHKYFFTYLYINTNTRCSFIPIHSVFHHLLLMFPQIWSRPPLLWRSWRNFGRSLSMFALSSPHDLEETTFLFRQIWEKNKQRSQIRLASTTPEFNLHISMRQSAAEPPQSSRLFDQSQHENPLFVAPSAPAAEHTAAQTQHKGLSLKRERRETAWRLYREKKILSLHHLSFSFTSRLCGKWKAPSTSHLKTSRGKLLHRDKRSDT